MSEAIESRLRALFAELFSVDPARIEDSTRRGELENWDSLGHLQLVQTIESSFGVTIGAQDALDVETFLDVRRLVERLLHSR